MSIYTALRAGVSGLTANSSALAVISDNIANVNTVGYKRGGVDFSALVNAQNSNTTYNAGGVLPLTMLVNGILVGEIDGRRQRLVEPPGPGFARLTVIDATGAADTVVIRVQ